MVVSCFGGYCFFVVVLAVPGFELLASGLLGRLGHSLSSILGKRAWLHFRKLTLKYFKAKRCFPTTYC
jgi:hypothetical protein